MSLDNSVVESDLSGEAKRMRSVYSVKEIFFTLQGEGGNAGRPAVFCRFAGCNLWSGREGDRKSAICNFCDTDFVGFDGDGGGQFKTAKGLAEACSKAWQGCKDTMFIVLTGGEPMLQVDNNLVSALHDCGFEVAVETNGTLKVPGEIDWICVSPKPNTRLEQTSGQELKLVFPQPSLPPEDLENLEFERFYLQPMDGTERELNTKLAIDYCLKNPKWRLSLQMHKYLGLR